MSKSIVVALPNGDKTQQRAIDYVRSHDDDTAEPDGVRQAFIDYFGRAPDRHDDPWSDLCAAIGEDD